jgi:hypothetical protein
VNYLENKKEPDEDEFLFVPYSVFKVAKIVEIDLNFYEIYLEASSDNDKEPLDLTLAPWH